MDGFLAQIIENGIYAVLKKKKFIRIFMKTNIQFAKSQSLILTLLQYHGTEYELLCKCEVVH